MKSNGMVLKLALTAGILGLFLSSAHAADPMEKLGRGFANSFTGVVEVPNQVDKVTQEENIFMGMTKGVCQGVGYALARTGVGLFEVATCLLPGPNHYEPLMEPEYAF